VAGVEGNGVKSGGSWSRSALFGGAAAAVGALGLSRADRLLGIDEALAAPSKAQDIRILQLVLLLEHTQVAFYEQALAQTGLKGDLRAFARTALGHERAHLSVIRSALGPNAGAKPKFDFGDNTKSAANFRKAAIRLEDVAVRAYNGQAPNLTKRTLAAAAEIVSVEARHAAWVRAIAGEVAAPEAVDEPMTAKQAADALHAIGLRA
jgi:Ferritin-like domain